MACQQLSTHCLPFVALLAAHAVPYVGPQIIVLQTDTATLSGHTKDTLAQHFVFAVGAWRRRPAVDDAARETLEAMARHTRERIGDVVAHPLRFQAGES
ncbi:hypothetical protein RSP795_21955 [Ralstonia solanacearum]|nr:hypothetical protein RSP795_21955 [Ralstonia solanacearum]